MTIVVGDVIVNVVHHWAKDHWYQPDIYCVNVVEMCCMSLTI